MSMYTHHWAVIVCQKAKVNSAVQVNLGGVCSEDKHLKGEAVGCRNTILQQLHCIIIWIGTPEHFGTV